MNNNNPAPAHSLSQIVQRRLPASARRKYRRLLSSVDDARARLGALDARRKSLEEDGSRLLLRRERLDPKTEADTIKDLEDEFESLRLEMEQMTAERDRISLAVNNTEQTIVACEMWLAAYENGVTVVGPLRAVSLPPLDTDVDVESELKAVQREIMTLQGQIARINAAPLPAAEIREAITAEVRKLAAQGTPQLRLDNGKVDLKFADMPLVGVGALSAPPGSATALMCWLFEDRIVELVTAGIDQAVADRGGGLSVAERTRRRADLEAETLLLEREEECLVEAALARGVTVYRRRAASVLAILGVEPTPFDEAEATALLDQEEQTKASRPADADEPIEDEASDEPTDAAA